MSNRALIALLIGLLTLWCSFVSVVTYGAEVGWWS